MKAGTRFKTGVTISAVGHVAVLGWGLVAFAVTPHDPEPVEALAIDVISPSDFAKMTAGMRNAKQVEAPKPLVEKIGEQKLPDNEATKVVDTFEVKASAEQPPPPKPPEPPKKPEPPKEAKVEPKPEPKPEPKVDQIAEALKKEEPKKKPEPPKEAPKPEAKQQPKKEPPPKKPEREFSQSFIQQRLAMVDKRAPQRHAATGETLNQTASLGTARGTAPQISMTWVQALKARMNQCWSPPVALATARDVQIVVRIDFKKDGSLARNPMVVNDSRNPAFLVGAESAVRAVQQCAPFTFLPPDQYSGPNGWNSIEFIFDPRDLTYG